MSLKKSVGKKEVKFTIGCDPELFLRDENNDIAPAYKYIKGTKDKPEPITDKGHAIQYDNCSVEYNIPPCNTADEFVENNQFVLNYIKDSIATPNNLKIDISPYVEILEKDSKHKIALLFGCSPDWNAWT